MKMFSSERGLKPVDTNHCNRKQGHSQVTVTHQRENGA